MQALIEFLVRNVMALWPIARIDEWQTGMIVRCGRIHRELGPGLHWRWWFIEEVKTWPTNEVGLDLDTAAVTTLDGEAVVLSANIGYRLVSIAKSWRGIWSMESTLRKIALGVIATDCACREWTYLRSHRMDLEAQLMAALNERLDTWGLVVTRVHLTDLVLAKPHRHYMDGAMAVSK